MGAHILLGLHTHKKSLITRQDLEFILTVWVWSQGLEIHAAFITSLHFNKDWTCFSTAHISANLPKSVFFKLGQTLRSVDFFRICGPVLGNSVS